MSILQNILNVIFGQTATGGTASPTNTNAPTQASTAVEAQTQRQPIDIEQILDGLAAKNSEDLNWKKSIVDLMKLLGMDSSLSARKELASELNYSGDTSDSAAMNTWLHKEVLRKLVENGGKVPASLLD